MQYSRERTPYSDSCNPTDCSWISAQYDDYDLTQDSFSLEASPTISSSTGIHSMVVDLSVLDSLDDQNSVIGFAKKAISPGKIGQAEYMKMHMGKKLPIKGLKRKGMTKLRRKAIYTQLRWLCKAPEFWEDQAANPQFIRYQPLHFKYYYTAKKHVWAAYKLGKSKIEYSCRVFKGPNNRAIAYY